MRSIRNSWPLLTPSSHATPSPPPPPGQPQVRSLCKDCSLFSAASFQIVGINKRSFLSYSDDDHLYFFEGWGNMFILPSVVKNQNV